MKTKNINLRPWKIIVFFACSISFTSSHQARLKVQIEGAYVSTIVVQIEKAYVHHIV